MDYLQAIMFILPTAKWHWKDSNAGGNRTYEDIVWDDLFYPKPTQEELETDYKYSQLCLQNGIDYRIERRKYYPSPEEQLQIIFDKGLDGWREYIQNVKNNVPKPNE